MNYRALPSPLQHLATRRVTPGLGWRDITAWLLLALALARGILMVGHAPLVALANNYDQVRYTACLDLYPVRPGVPPTQQNYQAPLQDYAFQKVADQSCYLTSDLLFQGMAALIFEGSERAGGSAMHSVRTLGILRLIAWMIVAVFAVQALRREDRSDLAVVLGVWLVVLGFDPVNSMLLNSFYAEAAAIFFAFCVVVTAMLCALRTTRWRLLLVALASLGLATSKFQHLALPVFAAAVIAAIALRGDRKLWGLVAATLLGTAPALALQGWQMSRGDAMTASIRIANNTDFALTALLPASDDAARTAQRIGLAADCGQVSGKSIYTLSTPPEQACPGISQLSRARALGLAFSEPRTLLNMAVRTPGEILPWIPSYLGLVEGAEVAPLPDDFFSLSRLIGKHDLLASGLLLAPLAGWFVVLWRRSADPSAPVFTALCATIAVTVPAVSVFGDGFAETAKHAHLALNAGCAFVLACVLVPLLRHRNRRVT